MSANDADYAQSPPPDGENPPGVNTCGNWECFHDFMPPGEPTLRVTGQCTFPTLGYTVTLKRAEPQGINPEILMLEKVVNPPSGPAGDQIDTVEVRYEEDTRTRYKQVHILPDGVLIDVQIVS